MSKVFNRSSCGSGSTASIFAYGDDLSSTDTCYATKDGKIYNGVWTTSTVGEETKNGFLISKLKDYGTYTLTCSNGTKTTTKDVEVDMATQFDVEISYIYYLYNLGNECESITGGWGSTYTVQQWSGGNSTKLNTVSATFNTENINIYHDTTYSLIPINTLNKVNLSRCSTLYMDWECSASYMTYFILTNSLSGVYAIAEGSYSWGSDVLQVLDDVGGNNTFSRQIKSYDISNISEACYLVVHSMRGNSGDTKTNATVYRIWAE